MSMSVFLVILFIELKVPTLDSVSRTLLQSETLESLPRLAAVSWVYGSKVPAIRHFLDANWNVNGSDSGGSTGACRQGGKLNRHGAIQSIHWLPVIHHSSISGPVVFVWIY